MKAFSDRTGREYESWEALLEAETNGYLVIAIITKGKATWPWVQGPYADKAEAERARNRMRTQMKKDFAWYMDRSFKLFVRPLWKEKS